MNAPFLKRLGTVNLIVALSFGVNDVLEPHAAPAGHSVLQVADAQDRQTKDWLTYKWGAITFKYPPDWVARKDYYLTPAEQAAGKQPSEIGLTLYPEFDSSPGGTISFGGRQADCESPSFVNLPRCFTIGAPVYTVSQDPKVLQVYDLMLGTILLNNPNTEFQIVTPKHGDKLRPNGTYTIRWTTKPGLHLPTVSIRVTDTSRYWKEGTVLSVDVPNTGSYRWTVPAKVPCVGPYLLTVLFIQPTRSGSGRVYQGTSNPFFIIADQ